MKKKKESWEEEFERRLDAIEKKIEEKQKVFEIMVELFKLKLK